MAILKSTRVLGNLTVNNIIEASMIVPHPTLNNSSIYIGNVDDFLCKDLILRSDSSIDLGIQSDDTEVGGIRLLKSDAYETYGDGEIHLFTISPSAGYNINSQISLTSDNILIKKGCNNYANSGDQAQDAEAYSKIDIKDSNITVLCRYEDAHTGNVWESTAEISAINGIKLNSYNDINYGSLSVKIEPESLTLYDEGYSKPIIHIGPGYSDRPSFSDMESVHIASKNLHISEDDGILIGYWGKDYTPNIRDIHLGNKSGRSHKRSTDFVTGFHSKSVKSVIPTTSKVLNIKLPQTTSGIITISYAGDAAYSSGDGEKIIGSAIYMFSKDSFYGKEVKVTPVSSSNSNNKFTITFTDDDYLEVGGGYSAQIMYNIVVWYTVEEFSD